MALVQLASYKLTAENQNTKGFHYFLPTALSVPNAILHAQAVAGLMDDVTGMVISEARLVVSVPLTGLKTTEIAGVFADRGVLIGFDVDASNYGWSGWVPGVDPAQLVAGLPSGAAIATFADYFISDQAGAGNGHATDDDGGELMAVTAKTLTTRRK